MKSIRHHATMILWRRLSNESRLTITNKYLGHPKTIIQERQSRSPGTFSPVLDEECDIFGVEDEAHTFDPRPKSPGDWSLWFWRGR